PDRRHPSRHWHGWGHTLPHAGPPALRTQDERVSSACRNVAMASSFAAGPGLPSRLPGSPAPGRPADGQLPAPRRSRARARPARRHLFGATTSDIPGPSVADPAAQLDALTPETSPVTFTAGGNNVGSAPRLTLASLPWPLRVLPSVAARADVL